MPVDGASASTLNPQTTMKDDAHSYPAISWPPGRCPATSQTAKRPGSQSRSRNMLRAGALFVLVAILLPGALHAYPVDLNSVPAYVQRGFDPAIVTVDLSESDLKSWKVLPPSSGRRPIAIPDVGLPGLPERRFPEFRELPSEAFTIAFFFTLSESDLDEMRNPVLLLAQIGENFQIFVNAEPVFHSRHEGPASIRWLRVPLNPRTLVAGKNHLILRVEGDPLSFDTGLFYGQPNKIEEASTAEKDLQQVLPLVLITIYLAVGLFHVFFFLSDGQRPYNLYFGGFAIALSLFIFSRTPLAHNLLDNATVLQRLALASVASALPLFSTFFIHLLAHRSRPFRVFHLVLSAHGWLVAGLALVFPSNLLYDLLRTWQSTVPVLLFALEGFIIFFFILDLRQLAHRAGLARGLYRAVFHRVSGNLLIGSFFVLSTSIYDIFMSLFFRSTPGASFYGFFVFLSGAAMRIAYDLLHLLRANQKLNRSLKANLVHLKRLHRTVAFSEQRYRKLIEETGEIILSLDHQGVITAANSSLLRELGVHPASVVGTEFIRLLEGDATGGAYSHGFTPDRIRQFYADGDMLKVRIPFFASQKKSHILFDVRLEKVHLDEGEEPEIFVRATPIEDDPALRYLVRESSHFEMTNDLYAVEDLVRRLIADLPRFLEEYEISMIRIGLRETIVNAIEHGNLGITFSEKSRLLAAGTYHNEVRHRLGLDHHALRRIHIQQTLTPYHVSYRITDEGEGFDHENFDAHPRPEDAATTLHGRGIFITRNAFSRVLFNRSGNSVLLVRDLRQGSTADTRSVKA